MKVNHELAQLLSPQDAVLDTSLAKNRAHPWYPADDQLVCSPVVLARRSLLPAVGRHQMLFTIAVILFIAWLLGIVGVYTVGSFIHALLVIALVLFVIGLFTGRRAAL